LLKSNPDPAEANSNSDPAEAKNNSEVLLPESSNIGNKPMPPPNTGNPIPAKRPPTTSSEVNKLVKVSNPPTTFLQLDTLSSKELLTDPSISNLMPEIISNSHLTTAGRIMDLVRQESQENTHHLERKLKR
jgi:hypothetical protein